MKKYKCIVSAPRFYAKYFRSCYNDYVETVSDFHTSSYMIIFFPIHSWINNYKGFNYTVIKSDMHRFI